MPRLHMANNGARIFTSNAAKRGKSTCLQNQVSVSLKLTDFSVLLTVDFFELIKCFIKSSAYGRKYILARYIERMLS